MKKLLTLLLIVSCINGWAQQNLISKTDTTVSFKVFGNCEMCKVRIENATKIKGVIQANWDIDTKQFTLQYDPAITSPQKVQKRIAEVGHDTELEIAKDYIYKDLPDCCLYRNREGKDLTHHDDESEENSEVQGVIMEMDSKGNLNPLAGANARLLSTKEGDIANNAGYFKLNTKEAEAVLEITYTGYQPQRINVKAGQHLTIVLNAAKKELQEVKIVANRKGMFISPTSTVRTQIITEKELFKAACCNLSESFETNPSVDVSYSDAVSGAKQIQLLGLSGNYSQLTVENMPGPRGIATPWGLNSIPGTWVESIELTKGVGSVINGFESITGQINVELKKSDKSEKLYANAYINNMGKVDLNLNLTQKINDKWSTALLLHDAFLENKKIDFNNDGFRDLPTGNLFSFMNRWKYDNEKGFIGQIGIRILTDNKIGGESEFNPAKHQFTSDYYGLGIETNRSEVFSKLGYVFPEKRYKSIGLQLAAFRHKQYSYFGLTEYDALQKNIYANLIYQSIIANTNHKFRTGLSFIADNYDETYKGVNYIRTENIPGAFFEYTYSKPEKINIIFGLRADNNSLFGFFLTPRFHLKYEPIKGTAIRISAGRGQRTANIFAENTSVFVSSREVTILNASLGKAYGLDPEIAWSEGLGVDQKFRLFSRNGTVAIDFFRTDFKNQVVVDMDKSARQVNFYNLDGRSYANSFQTEINYEIIKKFELRLAYRLFDVKATYHNKLLERPLLSRHRGFINLANEIRGWKFDYTVTYNGTKRIPYTGDNVVNYQLKERSPSYFLMNAQVSKTIGKKFPVDLYLGGENLTNYFQPDPIIASSQPFSQYFDASLVWGPVSGRMFYTGMRLKIK